MSDTWPRAHRAVWLVTCAIAVASWAGLARGQEEATVAGRPAPEARHLLPDEAGDRAMSPIPMRKGSMPTADQDNWRLHGRTYDNQRFSPLTDINASQCEAAEADGHDPDRRHQQPWRPRRIEWMACCLSNPPAITCRPMTP